MKTDKFIHDLEAFIATKPSDRELTEWMDTYSVTKAELARVISSLTEMVRAIISLINIDIH